MTCIVFALQLSAHAGAGAFVTLAAASISFVILILGLRQGDKDITNTDSAMLAVALVALVVWLGAHQPIISAILLSLTELLAFIPTIRKSWKQPHSETAASYGLNTLRFGLAIMALQHYTIVTTLYPTVWLIGNGLFAFMLVLRRRQLAPQS